MPFPSPQTAGDLNVIVVGASDSAAQVASVTDSNGNTYVPAVGPTVHPGGFMLAIYYAANITGAAANTVNVTFTSAVDYPDIRIAEYSGIDPVNPLEATAANQGTSGTSNSGPLTTTQPVALLVAANQVETQTSSAGAGFNSRIITNPNGDILEDQIVSSPGTYSATAALSPSGDWVMQMAAFRGIEGNAVSFDNQVVVQGLNFVPSMVFLPDGKMYMAEIGGTIRVVQPGGIAPDPTPVNVLPNAVATGDAGLLDMILDPNFAQNNYYYVFYAQTAGNSMRDKVSRFTATADWNSTVPGSEFVVWQDAPDSNDGHHGAGLGFGPDGRLYISTGDHFGGASQSLSNYRGKVLRINSDGTIPTDNPFFDGAGPNMDEIWAYGLRNPFRISFDPVTGNMYLGDVGGNDDSTAVEEVNLIVAGANYGWPQCEGPCGTPGFTNPIYYWEHQFRDACVIGGFVYRGTQFPSQYQGDYFFADYAQNTIKRLTLDPTGTVVTGVFPFLPLDGSLDDPEIGDPVQLRQGPDGALYYLDLSFDEQALAFNAGTLRRVSFQGSGNQAPTVAMAATPLAGAAPLLVEFSSEGSTDPEGDPLSFQWDFGDGNASTEANPVHSYQQNGTYLVSLIVSDGTSAPFETLTVTVGNPPQGVILTPGDNELFRAGDQIFISGDGTDPQDGTLPDSAFTWTVVFHHSGHQHPATGPISGVRNLVFNIPASGHDFNGFTRYEVILSVTDADGLQHVSSIFIFPDKVNLSVDTAPSGLTVDIDGISKTTPFLYDTVKGFQHTLNAPDQVQGANQHDFVSWSDGGAQSHGIIVPDQDSSYVATFTEVTPPPTLGLLAAYALDENSGTTADDISGNNHAATISGATWTTGNYGSALSFNGANNYASVGDVDIPASAFTLSLWLKHDAPQSGWASVVMKRFTYGFELKGTTLYFGIGNGSSWSNEISMPFGTGVWQHVAAVFTGSSLSVYSNGVQVGNAVSATLTNSDVPLLFGSWTGSGEFFAGQIDNVRLYDRALTLSEIQTDMNTPVGVGPPPSDTTDPQVALTSPAGGSQVSGTVALTADASDDVGVVGVQFFVDGAAIGAEDTTEPYGVNWDTTGAADGAHNLTATARDAAGNTTTSAIVPVDVANADSTDPQVSITSPAGGSQVSGTVALTADASDDVDVVGVQFFVDGAPIGAEDTSEPFGVNWDTTGVADGLRNLTATARDAAGNTSTSAVVAVDVANTDTTDPQVSITSPAGGSQVSGTVALTADASDDVGVVGVQFFVDGAAIGAEDTTEPFGVNWDTTGVANGLRNLTATARDAAGNTSTSAVVAVDVANTDTTDPQVSITSPAGGSQVSGTVALAADASDEVGVVGVQFFVDGAAIGAEDATEPFGVNWDTTGVANGLRNLTATARDAAGNTSTSAVVAVDVANTDTSDPQVSITSPAGGSQVSGTVALAADASDEVGVVGVQFFVDGAAIGAEDTTEPFGVNWDTTGVANGLRNLTATARDAAGNTSTSAIVAVDVANTDTTDPQVSITSPAGGSEVSGTIALAANASDEVGVVGVQFFVDGAPIGVEDTTEPFGVNWDTTGVANGLRNLTATARDAAGNTATSAIVAVSVANIAVSPNQIVAYGLDETSGTLAADASGNGLNGTLTNGPVWIAGQYGNALSLDGANDYVAIGDVDIPGSVFTMSLWIKIDAPQSGWGSVFMKRFTYGFEAKGSTLYFGVGNGSSWSAEPSLSLDTGVWQHVAAVFNGNSLSLYKNGVQVGGAVAATLSNSNTPLQIGAWTNSSEFFRGQIDNVKLYSQALTSAEIQTDMNTPLSGTP